MILDHTFKKMRVTSRERTSLQQKPEIPDGLLRRCNKCGKPILTNEVEENFYICPKCGGYFRVHARRRVEMIADPDTFTAWDEDILTENPMEYRGYEEKIDAARERTGLSEAVLIGKAQIRGIDTVLGVCDNRFLMGSMGRVVGERITRAFERAAEEKLPVILFASSGGARMQEGITSLMQMTKTSAAVRRHSDAGQLFISVLTDPTMGGVTASFAMLGDIILAEPKALIGFAGPRVIEQTIGQKLPKGFQSSEFLLEHGFLDGIVERPQLRETLGGLLAYHQTPATKAAQLDGDAKSDEAAANAPVRNAKKTEQKKQEQKEPDKEAVWKRVQCSRNKERPVADDYISGLCDTFYELHGDRCFRDDPAIIGGLARIDGRVFTLIAQAKGTDTKENIRRNFGMPSPEGYRKAQRLLAQAEKFHRPVLCLVDTPGAFCGLEAEERGQGEAIASGIAQMVNLKTPVLSLIIGEGGSGGALALASGDEVWMLENSVYSILSPEGFASILWKDSTKAQDAAVVMGMTSDVLRRRGMVEKVFAEPEHFTKDTMEEVLAQIKPALREFLKCYDEMSDTDLLNRRYERFRSF